MYKPDVRVEQFTLVLDHDVFVVASLLPVSPTVESMCQSISLQKFRRIAFG